MGQGYIQSNPPHVVSWLHLLKTAIVQDLIILLFADYAISILLTSNQKRVYQLWPYDVKYRRQCIWRLSCNGISSDVILSSLVRRTQTAIFFNFLGHKNEVYGKLKPLQEKVKYTFFSKLYYRVSRKKSAQKINPAIGTEGSKRGHFLTIKMVVTKKYEFSWPKGLCRLVRMNMPVKKMSGSEKVIVGLKSRSISPRSAALTHNSPW